MRQPVSDLLLLPLPLPSRHPSDRLLRLLLHEQHDGRGAGRSGLRQSRHGGVQARRQAQRGDGGSHAGGQVNSTDKSARRELQDSDGVVPPPTPCSAPSSTPAAAARGGSACTTCRSTAAPSWPTFTATVRPTPSSTSSPNTVGVSLSSRPGPSLDHQLPV